MRLVVACLLGDKILLRVNWNDIWTLAGKMTSFRFPEKVNALGLRLGLAEIRLNTFSIKRPFGHVH